MDLPPLAAGLQTKFGAGVAIRIGAASAVVWPAVNVATRLPVPEAGVCLPWLEHGALLALIRLPAGARDARGDDVAAGDYTLRYAVQPRLKDHVDVSASRDFALLVPLARDAAGGSGEGEALAQSRPAPGRHPHVLALAAVGDASCLAGADPSPGMAFTALRLAGREVVLIIGGRP